MPAECLYEQGWHHFWQCANDMLFPDNAETVSSLLLPSCKERYHYYAPPSFWYLNIWRQYSQCDNDIVLAVKTIFREQSIYFFWFWLWQQWLGPVQVFQGKLEGWRWETNLLGLFHLQNLACLTCNSNYFGYIKTSAVANRANIQAKCCGSEQSEKNFLHVVLHAQQTKWQTAFWIGQGCCHGLITCIGWRENPRGSIANLDSHQVKQVTHMQRLAL